jgi:hypothetical protein
VRLGIKLFFDCDHRPQFLDRRHWVVVQNINVVMLQDIFHDCVDAFTDHYGGISVEWRRLQVDDSELLCLQRAFTNHTDATNDEKRPMVSGPIKKVNRVRNRNGSLVEKLTADQQDRSLAMFQESE